MISRVPFFLPWIYPDFLWRIKTSEKKIYLTFDDGPVPGPTPYVLDVLKSHAIKATFFMIGDNVMKHPQLAVEIMQSGHKAGNHTQHHMNGWSNTTNDYLLDVKKCDETFLHSSISTNLFRPPYGRIKRKQAAGLSQKSIVMWDVLTGDYDQSRTPGQCRDNSLHALRPGSIVVFHDSLKAEKNMSEALPGFIEGAKERGYEFELIGE